MTHVLLKILAPSADAFHVADLSMHSSTAERRPPVPAPVTPGAMRAVTPSVISALIDERLDPPTILNALVRSVPGLIGAALATTDGRGIAHSDQLTHDPGRAAMIAAAMGLSGQLIGTIGGTDLQEIVIRSEAGYVMVYSVGDAGVLTVLGRRSTNLLHTNTEVRARLDRLVNALRGDQS